MSVFSPKRVLFAVLAAVLLAANAFASNPSPRNYARMVFDPQSGESILFGGTGPFDLGTQRAYDSNETWAFTGARWAQRYPAHSPSARAAQAMAYDSGRGRIVLFGGRAQLGTATGEIRTLGDTWVYDNGDWTELTPPVSPTPRQLAAMAYDSVRDRMVLYGGFDIEANGLNSIQKNDTWEFDGTTWTQVGDESVKVARPNMAFDVARNQMIMVGTDAEFKTVMYRFDAPTKTWVKLTPEKFLDCANDSSMVYQSHNNTILSVGGLCGISFVDKTWEWNGTAWNEVKTVAMDRMVATSLAYDALRATAILFGGSEVGTTAPRSATNLYRNNNWSGAVMNTRPSPRSLFAFTHDPANQSAWLFGGLNEYSNAYLGDLWGLRNGQWFQKTVKDIPACDAPLSAFDSNRSKLVFACWPTAELDVAVYEFDGAAFTKIDSTKNKPDARRWGTLVYDETLKKVVLFGGFDGSDFRDDTWTWDGSNWTEVKKDKPPNRSLHAMWYDPLQKKTMLYGGIGRESIEDHVQRFSDMWAFNGNGWTKLTVTSTPGERLGAQYAVDPVSGKVLLFGGMKSELTDPDKDTSRRQFYDNETWLWDGAASTWTKLSTATSPAARQNGRLAYDPVAKRLTLYGGFAGMYFSEIWQWTGSNWELVPDLSGSGRRRAAGPLPVPATPSEITD